MVKTEYTWLATNPRKACNTCVILLFLNLSDSKELIHHKLSLIIIIVTYKAKKKKMLYDGILLLQSWYIKFVNFILFNSFNRIVTIGAELLAAALSKLK